MYKIEKVGENVLYVKALGMFPPSVAQSFVKDFSAVIHEMKNFSVIVDGTDFLFMNVDSLQIIIDLLKQDNKKLIKAAYVVDKNPPLAAETQYIFDQAASEKRKIVQTLDEAKDWIGISDIIFQRED